MPSPTPPSGYDATPGPLVVAPIELRAPKEPFHFEGQIKPVETKPIEIKPLQVELLSKEGLRVTTSGIPDKVKIEWEAKPISLALRWPDDPLKVTVELKNVEGARRENSEPCDCNDSPRQKKQPSPIQDADKGSHKTDHPIADEGTRRGASPWIILLLFLEPILAGAIGGFSIGLVESVDGRRKTLEELKRIRIAHRPSNEPADAVDPDQHAKSQEEAAILSSLFGKQADKRVEQQTEFKIFYRDLAPEFSHYTPAILLGIIAAMIVPGLLILFPGGAANVSPEDPFSLLRLWSLCLMAAMVGEPFIRFALKQVPTLSKKSDTTLKQKTGE